MSLESIISSSWCTKMRSSTSVWNQFTLTEVKVTLETILPINTVLSHLSIHCHSHSFLPLNFSTRKEKKQISYMKKEEFISQSGESLTVIGGRGPLEQALSNLSSKQGYLQGAAQGCFHSNVEYLQGQRLHSAIRLHLEQEGGSSLLYKVHPENKRQRNSWLGLGLPLRAVAQGSLSRHECPNFCFAWATVSKDELFVDNVWLLQSNDFVLGCELGCSAEMRWHYDGMGCRLDMSAGDHSDNILLPGSGRILSS